MISEKEFFQNVDQIVTSLEKNKNEKLNKGGWKIDQKTYNFLNEIVEKFKTDTVCEFGSGLSTNLFADNIIRKNINKVYSIEHMQDFEGHPKKYIKKLNIKEKIKFINAPIKLQFFEKKLFNFYKIPKNLFSQINNIDLLFIDGPPYYYFSREAALYNCYNKLSNQSIIILDDANRITNEKIMIDNWKKIYKNKIKIKIFEKEFEKGICVALVNKSNSSKEKFFFKEIFYSFIKSLYIKLKLSIYSFIGKI